MPSRFDEALARADEAQLRIFGEDCTFHDPSTLIDDTAIRVVFSERDIEEPPNHLDAPRGHYSTAWTLLTQLPIEDPSGYQILSGDDTYSIGLATADGGGGVVMKLYREENV